MCFLIPGFGKFSWFILQHWPLAQHCWGLDLLYLLVQPFLVASRHTFPTGPTPRTSSQPLSCPWMGMPEGSGYIRQVINKRPTVVHKTASVFFYTLIHFKSVCFTFLCQFVLLPQVPPFCSLCSGNFPWVQILHLCLWPFGPVCPDRLITDYYLYRVRNICVQLNIIRH